MMKYAVLIFIHFILVPQFLEAQEEYLRPDTIVEADDQFFMPGLVGIKERTVVVAPDIARQRPSQVNILKKKLDGLTDLLYEHPLLTGFKGLKVNFTTEIFSLDGFNELVRWLPSKVQMDIRTTLAVDSLPSWEPSPEAWIVWHINNPRKLVGNPIINDIYLSPAEMGTTGGWKTYDRISVPNRISVASGNSSSLFEPVSREDFILSLITYFQTSIEKGEKQAATRKPAPETGEEGIRMNLEFRKFEESLKEIRKYDPQLAEKLMQAYIESGRPMLESEPETSGNNVDRMIVLNTWREAVRKLKAEMNAMSPLERKAQAWWSNTEDSNVSGLTPPGYSGSRPLIRLNKNLIDKTKPNSAIQLIVAEWSMIADEEFIDSSGYNLAYSLLYKLGQDQNLWSDLQNMLAQ